jgi:uncharacterized membrane protein YhaH (DUF805 family)
MGFLRAVGTCFRKYLIFEGRAGLAEYWWWFLFRLLAFAGAIAIDIAVIHSREIPLFAVTFLALILPSLAVAARRLHDINCSAWWLLIGLIPFGGLVLLVMAFMPGTEGTNDYDRTWW